MAKGPMAMPPYQHGNKTSADCVPTMGEIALPGDRSKVWDCQLTEQLKALGL